MWYMVHILRNIHHGYEGIHNFCILENIWWWGKGEHQRTQTVFIYVCMYYGMAKSSYLTYVLPHFFFFFCSMDTYNLLSAIFKYIKTVPNFSLCWCKINLHSVETIFQILNLIFSWSGNMWHDNSYSTGKRYQFPVSQMITRVNN